MTKQFFGPMAMGLVAGAMLGMAAAGMTTERTRERLREQAGRAVRELF